LSDEKLNIWKRRPIQPGFYYLNLSIHFLWNRRESNPIDSNTDTCRFPQCYPQPYKVWDTDTGTERDTMARLCGKRDECDRRADECIMSDA
jgi:hypothetical protein